MPNWKPELEVPDVDEENDELPNDIPDVEEVEEDEEDPNADPIPLEPKLEPNPEPKLPPVPLPNDEVVEPKLPMLYNGRLDCC